MSAQGLQRSGVQDNRILFKKQEESGKVRPKETFKIIYWNATSPTCFLCLKLSFESSLGVLPTFPFLAFLCHGVGCAL